MMRRRLGFLQKLAALTALLVAVACATVAPKSVLPLPQPVTPGPAVSIPIAPPPPPPGKFALFLQRMHEAAGAQGISDDSFARAIAGLAPLAAIAAMNDNQPEFAEPVWSYLDGAVSARRIKDGQAMHTRYAQTLDALAAEAGVPQEILLAIWGMESDFGRDSGSFNLFAALATLGYDGPRADYAAPEFLAALKIMQEQHYAVPDMKSSWAGAFGQTQFTPTTFLKYAVDGDHDGHIDLWASPADALASAANLLVRQGWKPGEPWGYEVKLPKDFAYEDADVDAARPLADWRQRGVRTIGGAPLPPDAADASIYLPAGARGPAFVLLPNFRVILKYNNAASYALAVSVLADRIMGRAGVKSAWPRDERPLSRGERLVFQQDLTRLGFDTGTPDGVLGRKTRSATRDYQKSHGLPADGFPTTALLAALEAAKKE